MGQRPPASVWHQAPGIPGHPTIGPKPQRRRQYDRGGSWSAWHYVVPARRGLHCGYALQLSERSVTALARTLLASRPNPVEIARQKVRIAGTLFLIALAVPFALVHLELTAFLGLFLAAACDKADS